VSVRGFSSSTRSARRVGFAGLSGVDQPRPTLRGPADESSAFDVDPADLVFARAWNFDRTVSKAGAPKRV